MPAETKGMKTEKTETVTIVSQTATTETKTKTEAITETKTETIIGIEMRIAEIKRTDTSQRAIKSRNPKRARAARTITRIVTIIEATIETKTVTKIAARVIRIHAETRDIKRIINSTIKTKVLTMKTGTDLLKTDERLDDLQRNNLKIIQSPGRFCFGMDAVLLSGFVHTKRGDELLDMGTGTGILPILLSAKTECKTLTGLEIQEESADMARRSVEYNDLGDRVKIVRGDIKESCEIFGKSSFDVITCNPPYMIGKHGISNEEEPKAIARHEIKCTFEDVAAAASGLLKPGGHFFWSTDPSGSAR